MTAQNLTNKSCVPCEGGVPPLDAGAIDELMQALHGDWQVSADGKTISRRFDFERFTQTMGFVNAVAWIAECEGHHPEMQVSFRWCSIEWRTHAIDGLTENDFICAAKVDRLLT